MKKIYYLLFISIITVIFQGCVQNMEMQAIRPIMGNWTTDNGLEMSIRPTPDTGVSAVIVSSGAFVGEDTKIGKVILMKINFLVDGGYTGYFIMPGEQKPLKVKMVLLDRDTLLISLWDIRKMGNSMKWKRVVKPRQ